MKIRLTATGMLLSLLLLARIDADKNQTTIAMQLIYTF